MTTIRPLPASARLGNIGTLSSAPGCGADTLYVAFNLAQTRIVAMLKRYLGSPDDAHDVVQEALLKLLQRRQHLLDTNLPALLYVTARNIARDALRERSRWNFTSDEDVVAALADECASPERIAAAREQLEMVDQLVAQLSEKCQLAFTSYHIDGLDYTEIARHLQLTESMVRKHVLRASRHCATKLAG